MTALVGTLLALSVVVLALLAANLQAWRRFRDAQSRRRAEFALEAAAVLADAARLCQSMLPQLRAGAVDVDAAHEDFTALRQAMRVLSPAAPPDPKILGSANRGFMAMGHAGRLAETSDPQAAQAFVETANIIWREREILLRLARRH